MKFQYSVIKVYPDIDPQRGQYWQVDAPTFEAKIFDSVDALLEGIPNVAQERDKGGWETYGLTVAQGRFIFLVRRPAGPEIIVPPALMGQFGYG